jgi:3-methyl-2-oxobutanoate hydroxymethyltransferase
VWQDLAGMRRGPMPRFVKQYVDLRTPLADAARAFADDVRGGTFPDEEHSFR